MPSQCVMQKKSADCFGGWWWVDWLSHDGYFLTQVWFFSIFDIIYRFRISYFTAEVHWCMVILMVNEGTEQFAFLYLYIRTTKKRTGERIT